MSTLMDTGSGSATSTPTGHADAFKKALKYLYDAHCDKPIRLEQIDSKPDSPSLNKG
jgi:hypothetical protein